MKVIELNGENFDNTIKEGVVFVKFGAGWCGPCKRMEPVLKKLAEEFEGKVTICEVDTERERELSDQYAIKNIPTLFIFEKGNEVYRESGYKDVAVLTAKLNHYSEKKEDSDCCCKVK